MDELSEQFKGKRILVTGGAGFIGRNLVSWLARGGSEVTVLDDLFTGRLENLRGVDETCAFVRGSVTDRELIASLMAESDVVFHLAARNIIASTRDPYEDFQTNIGGTLNVLAAAREHPIDRVVYASSASVYGNPRHLPINEDDRVSLLTPYAVSKFAGEGYCQAFYESYAVPVVVVRYSNVFGPGQDPQNPYCGVVARFMKRASESLPLELHGDGEQTRDFTYVDDVIEATLSAALSKKAVGEVFNVATGIETSVSALARLVLDLYGRQVAPVSIDRRDIDNIRRRVLNVEKIRRTLRWTPRIPLAAGLQRTCEWLRQLEVKSQATAGKVQAK
jgi:UDP-glucose 4-epimerase